MKKTTIERAFSLGLLCAEKIHGRGLQAEICRRTAVDSSNGFQLKTCARVGGLDLWPNRANGRWGELIEAAAVKVYNLKDPMEG